MNSYRRKMPHYHALLAILLLFLLTLAAAHPPPAVAAPAQQGTNLLQNPGFEQPFVDGAAQNWTRWFRETEKQSEDCTIAYHFRPKWNIQPASTDLVRQGSASQYIGNNWDTWSGGVYQTVAVTPGATYRFTFSARGRGSNEPSPAASETGLNMNIRAGIDPNGSGLWNDTDVVWGSAGSPHDQWQQFTVQATATGNQVTVFTSADWGVTGANQCRQFMDTWYDAAELVAAAAPTAIAQSSPTPAPQPTQPSAATPTLATGATQPAATVSASLTPGAEATTPAETTAPVGGGTICVNAFLDENDNGLHEANEGYVSGVTLTVAQGDLLVGQAVSTGTDAPVCFPSLSPGTYQVAQTVPPALEMTTQANATIEVEEGQTVGLEFGSRLRPAGSEQDATATGEAAAGVDATATAEAATPTEESGAGLNPLAIGGLVAIILGLILLGVLLYYIMRR
jgi:hypothetical protein